MGTTRACYRGLVQERWEAFSICAIPVWMVTRMAKANSSEVGPSERTQAATNTWRTFILRMHSAKTHSGQLFTRYLQQSGNTSTTSAIFTPSWPGQAWTIAHPGRSQVIFPFFFPVDRSPLIACHQKNTKRQCTMCLTTQSSFLPKFDKRIVSGLISLHNRFLAATSASFAGGAVVPL